MILSLTSCRFAKAGFVFAGAALMTLSSARAANFAGVNFSGDPALAAQQSLGPTDAAGFFPQKFWANAAGTNGQVDVEIDGGTSIPVFYSGFTAHWQGARTGAGEAGSLLPNHRLMRGSLLSNPGASVLVQFAGIPLSYTSVGYALLVNCDIPGNSSNVAIRATLQAGATVRTLHLRDRAGSDFAGTFARAALNSEQLTGNTPAANVFIFTGLTASDLAVSIEPASSNPSASVAVNAMQLVPASSVQLLAPRIVSPLESVATLNEPFSYVIQTDVAATGFGAQGLPGGLMIDHNTGLISGSPAQAGTYPVTLTATNAAGSTSETLQLIVSGAPPASLQIYMVPAVVVRGQPGETYLIEYVDTLHEVNDWQPVATVTLTNTVWVYVDLTATNTNSRFYRSRLQP